MSQLVGSPMRRATAAANAAASPSPARRSASGGASASGGGGGGAGSVGGGSGHIRVCVRIRPLFLHEAQAGDSEAVRALPDGRSLQAALGESGAAARQFSFDAVVGPEASQSDLFRLSGARALMDDALRGLNASVLAYGQTGSGKTYSMSGVAERDGGAASGGGSAAAAAATAGLIPRAVDYLFAHIGADEEGGAAATTVHASFCEIYNENVYDLLNLSGEPLSMRYSPASGFFVQGQLVVQCSCARDVLEVLQEGHRTRSVGSHALNADSSRSHSVLTLVIERTAAAHAGDDDEPTAITTRSKVIFVDLAGSERVKDSHSEGVTAVESRQINKSLFVLGKVIAALSDQQRRSHSSGGGSSSPLEHVPYRDSRLTKLLADSLGGSARTLILSCVTPASGFVDETLSTLQYSLRASCIENAPVVQLSSDGDAAQLAAILRRENQSLRRENEMLRARLGLPAAGPVDQLLAALFEQAQAAPPYGPHGAQLLLQQGNGGSLHLGGGGNAASSIAASGSPRGDDLFVHGSGGSIVRQGGGSLDGGGESAGAGSGAGVVPQRLPVKPRESSSLAGRRSRSGSSKAGRSNAAAAAAAAQYLVMDVLDQQLLQQQQSLSLRAPPFSSHVSERMAERGGAKRVIDVQQAELEALSKERETLRQRGKAAKARIAALTFTLEGMRTTVERMAREVELSRRNTREVEKQLASVLALGKGSLLASVGTTFGPVATAADLRELESLRAEVVELRELAFRGGSDTEAEATVDDARLSGHDSELEHEHDRFEGLDEPPQPQPQLLRREPFLALHFEQMSLPASLPLPGPPSSAEASARHQREPAFAPELPLPHAVPRRKAASAARQSLSSGIPVLRA